MVQINMKNDRVIPTGMDLPQRVKALLFEEGDAVDAEGRYIFIKKLGHGAMGKVFLFRDARMGGLRALKTVDEILTQYPEAVESLKRECKMMQKLTHPNIVAVRDLVMDSWKYRYYIVMDYAKGETLREYLENQQQKPRQATALEVVRLMAVALDHAHENNIVHGDVKPENTMVEIGDDVKSLKLSDFGLSYHIQATTASLSGFRMSAKGTAPYMAPELFEMEYGDGSEPQKPGKEVDLYALGTVAYEMLAGRRPFNGPNEIVLAHKVIYEEVPKIEGLPDYMNAVLKRMLAKRPEERFGSCAAFAEALSAAPVPAPIVVTPPPVAPPQPRPAIVRMPSPQPLVNKTPLTLPLDGKDTTLMLSGDVPLEMVHIRAGSFMMGSPLSEEGRYDDEKQHKVTLTKDFWLGRYPVTQGQWQAVMGTTLLDQANKAHPGEGEKYIGNKGGDYPMYYVSWEDAMEFCGRLTERERSSGRLPEGYEYTLPTESQWEYACRAGTGTALYSGGIRILGERNAPALDGIAWYGGNSSVGYEGVGWDTEGWPDKQYPGGFAGPRLVGRKSPNAWGLYDMLGNVWEWCRDWYGAYPDGNATDPVGPSSGSYRVGRGGSWNGDARRCRSAYRGHDDPSDRGNDLGFRVALASVQ